MASFPKCGWRIPASFYISMKVLFLWKEISDLSEWSDFSVSALIVLSDLTWMWSDVENQWKVAPFHWLFCFSVWLSWVIDVDVIWSWKSVKRWPLFSDFSASVFDWAERLMGTWFEVKRWLAGDKLISCCGGVTENLLFRHHYILFYSLAFFVFDGFLEIFRRNDVWIG